MSRTGGSLIIQPKDNRRSYDPSSLRGHSAEENDGPLTRSVDSNQYKFYDEDRDSVSRRQNKLGGPNDYSKTASSVDSLEVSRIQRGTAEFDRTVDTNISMPLDHETPSIRADRYEEAAADKVNSFDEYDDDDKLGPVTPSPAKPGAASRSFGNQSTGSGSPFYHMGDDTNDAGSLALSESHETFADLDASSKSIDYRK
jgi:hypothetical protein